MKKDSPTPEQVASLGEPLVQFPVLQDDEVGFGTGTVYQTPDGTRYLVFESIGKTKFGTLKQMRELISAYEQVLEVTKLGLELFMGEDRKSPKH